MKISLNIQVILSIILGIVLFWNSSSAIAEIPEPSLTPLSNNEKLESGKIDFSSEAIHPEKPVIHILDEMQASVGDPPENCSGNLSRYCSIDSDPLDDNDTP